MTVSCIAKGKMSGIAQDHINLREAMNFTILKINGSPLYIPTNKVGIVSVCNNKDGSELVCLVKESTEQRRSLHIGDRLEIELIAQNSIETPSKLKLPDNFNIGLDENYPGKGKTSSEGMEIVIGSRVICMPFLPGGVLSVMLTVNKGRSTINLGGMTPDNELLDYYYSELAVGDSITISLKNLNNTSEPIRKRKFKDFN